MSLRGIAVVNLGVALALLFILVNIQFEHEITLRRQEKELAELRIDIMLSQIQPHFLYNVLTAIRKLCEIDPVRAGESVSAFSKFLRANMDSLTNKAPIPFEQELEHVRSYLYLEQQRFGDRLHVSYDIQAINFCIPPLTLQPIAENAVRHGIRRKEDGGTLTIRSEERGDAFIVTVTDDGAGFSPEKKNRPAEISGEEKEKKTCRNQKCKRQAARSVQRGNRNTKYTGKRNDSNDFHSKGERK